MRVEIRCHAELRRYLTATETGNGFGNRFLWVCAKRSKVLPERWRPPSPGLWGEAVVRDGSLWICKVQTPGEPSKDFVGWQLAVRKGSIS